MRHSSISHRARSAGRGPGLPGRGRATPPALEWAEDATGRCPRLTAVGNHSLLVENHTGIAAFSEERIALNSRSGVVCALGRGLSLSCARAGALIIRGEIRRVELPCREGEGPDEG